MEGGRGWGRMDRVDGKIIFYGTGIHIRGGLLVVSSIAFRMVCAFGVSAC